MNNETKQCSDYKINDSTLSINFILFPLLCPNIRMLSLGRPDNTSFFNKNQLQNNHIECNKNLFIL